jgi:phosphatidylglycerol:prolipoprotein diacylglycerol transferase
MCSELFRIPITAGGVPIFGFGVLLAAWLAFSAWGLASMAKIAGWSVALRSHLPTIVIMAAAIALFIPRFFPDGVPVRGYGVMVLIGSIAGILLAVYQAQRAGIAADEIMGLAVAMFIGGVAGARLFYVIEYWNDRIRQADWVSTLKAALSFTEGGLVIYGAFVGAMIGFAIYARQRKLPGLALADLIAPSMIVGLAFGRIGCFLNGCCYGGETNVPWAVTFPRESDAHHISPPYGDQAAAGRFYGFRIGESGKAGKDNSEPIITHVDAGSAAEKAGLKAGDTVNSVKASLRADQLDPSLKLHLNVSNRSESDVIDVTVKAAEGEHALIADAAMAGQPVEIQTADGAWKTVPAVEPPPRSRPVHPTQVYSSITAGLLAWVLWSYYPLRRRDGEVTALMITLYPIGRFLEESIRVDEPAVFGTGLSISQNLSILLFVVALGMWLRLRKKPVGQLALPLAGANGT